MSYDSICCFRNSKKRGYRILFEITNRCNQKCAFCHAKGKKDVSVDDVKTILQHLSEIPIHDIILTGGEPLLNKAVFQIMNALQENNIDMDMCSNGSLVSRSIAKELKKYLSEISISLDTVSPIIYKELRGVDMLPKVYQGIDNLLSENIEVHLTCVVNQRNKTEVENIIKTAVQLGVRSVSFLRIIPDIATNFNQTQELAISNLECEEVLKVINECRKIYPLSINTKRLKNNICNEECGAGSNILGLTTEGCLVNCIMNRNSSSFDLLQNSVTEEDISKIFSFSNKCFV